MFGVLFSIFFENWWLIWLIGAIILFAVFLFYAAYKNQKSGYFDFLPIENNSDHLTDSGFWYVAIMLWLPILIIGLIATPVVFIGYIFYLVIKTIWQVLNTFMAHLIKMNEPKEYEVEKLPSPEIRLNGMELDNQLTKEFMEKQGWSNKN